MLRCQLNLKIKWESLRYGYQNRDDNLGSITKEPKASLFAFLFSINLPMFSEQISNTIEKVSNR